MELLYRYGICDLDIVYVLKASILHSFQMHDVDLHNELEVSNFTDLMFFWSFPIMFICTSIVNKGGMDAYFDSNPIRLSE